MAEDFRRLAGTLATVRARPGEKDIDAQQIVGWEIAIRGHFLRIGVLRITKQDGRRWAGIGVSRISWIDTYRDLFIQVAQRGLRAGRIFYDVLQRIRGGDV